MISNLKVLRQAAHLTQKELAEKTGVSQQKISMLEHNPPTYVKTIANICRVLGCSFEELFGTTLTSTMDRPTPDRSNTAASPPVRDNDLSESEVNDLSKSTTDDQFYGTPTDDLSMTPDILGPFVEVPVEKALRPTMSIDPDWKKKKYYVQLKSVKECLLDPECANDVEENKTVPQVYGINKMIYEELAAAPVKALYDGIRFYVADSKDVDFGDPHQMFSSWLVAPRFIKRVWIESPLVKAEADSE